MSRKPERDLREAVRDRGFTPGARDVAPLLELLGDADDDLSEGAEKALARLGTSLLTELLERFAAARPPLRGRLCRLVGRIGGEDERGRAFLLAALEDGDLKTQRNAVAALGRARVPGAEEALLRAWEKAERPELRRSLVEALGKVGGERSRERLREVHADEPQLARLVGRAALMLERTGAREEPSRVDAAAAPATPLRIVFFCRAGLEELLAAELGETWEPRIVARGRVEARLAGRLESAWLARTALGFAFPLEAAMLAPGESSADGVVRALTGDQAFALLRRFTQGPIRWRLATAHGGHRRAFVWECAQRIAERRPELRNDPTRSTWEAVVLERAGSVHIDLFPQALADPRFPWRVADVPAASHPTLAAALVRVGGVRADDVVWDPFVGSGGELLERARLGPYAQLLGTDDDPAALEAARRNAAAAGTPVRLVRADALEYVPTPSPTLIVTNPPMGRRLAGHRDLGALLDRFVDHAATVLVPGGRLVWLSPKPEATARRARGHGLRIELDREVDMGGFTARLQFLRKDSI
jgi:SAM-dependent methyltransferase